MDILELADNLLQLTVTLGGGIWSAVFYLRTRLRAFAFMASAQLSWAFGLIFWVLYLELRGQTPSELCAAWFAWSGALLFMTAVNQCLSEPGEDRYASRDALLAPLLTLFFVSSWFAFNVNNLGSTFANLSMGACLALLGWRSMASFLHHREAGRAWRARYHLCALGLMLFDCLLMFISLFLPGEAYTSFNLYYFFDLLVSLSLALLPWLLRKAVAA